MTERHELTLKVLCVVCGRPMTFVRTGSCADDVTVFECMPCGFSMTQSRTPPMTRGKAENRTEGAGIYGDSRNRCSRQGGGGGSPKMSAFSWSSDGLSAPVGPAPADHLFQFSLRYRCQRCWPFQTGHRPDR